MQREMAFDDTALYAARKYHPNYVLVVDGTLTCFVHGFVEPYCVLQTRVSGTEHSFPVDMLVYHCHPKH